MSHSGVVPGCVEGLIPVHPRLAQMLYKVKQDDIVGYLQLKKNLKMDNLFTFENC